MTYFFHSCQAPPCRCFEGFTQVQWVSATGQPSRVEDAAARTVDEFADALEMLGDE